ncbi:MAG: HDIG domain-containing protein [Clostridia bacterium]|nr:HDIG domain-containing protein [Clostridia bacterium]
MEETNTNLDEKRERIKFIVLSQIPMIIATCVISLFALFIFSDNFVAEFIGQRIPMTVGLFVSNYFILFCLFFALLVFDKEKFTRAKDFLLIVIAIAITYIACVAAVDFLNVYAIPIALCGLLIAILISAKSGICSVILLSMLLFVACMFKGSFSQFTSLSVTTAIICNTLASLNIIYFVSKHYTRIKFLLYALIAGLISLPFVIASTLATGILDIQLLYNVLWAIAANFIAVLLFMPLLAVFESAFNIADDFRLDEISNLNQPLLKRLASEAPGTFNHSLVVGTLAESCAMAIGDNPRLAKAGAYYHDVGKLKAPTYFVENQSDYNPHDELIPEVSVSMITSHTMFGEILNRQYRLPEEIVKISKEHHGTAPVGYFYQKALKLTEGTLSVANFVYPGPKPSTKISAIIMIADTTEAAFRAYMPPTKEEFLARIDMLVNEKMNLGQFDECPITMHDLAVIKQTIINVLPSIHHSRVNYETEKKPVAKKKVKNK